MSAVATRCSPFSGVICIRVSVVVGSVRVQDKRALRTHVSCIGEGVHVSLFPRVSGHIQRVPIRPARTPYRSSRP